MADNPQLTADVIAALSKFTADDYAAVVKEIKRRRKRVLLSSDSDDHGTCVSYVEAARYTLGSFDLDPCSNSYWNHWTVKARTFYDERIDCLKSPLYGNVLMNPPSCDTPTKKISVRPFWEKLVDAYVRGEVDAAVYVVFSLNQLTMLQSSPIHPLQFIAMFPRERGRFLQRGKHNGPPVPGDQPTHGNALVLMPTRRSPDARRAMVARFIERSKDLESGGAIVRPL